MNAIIAAGDLIRRSGGTQFEIGYRHEHKPVLEADWWAGAQMPDGPIVVEGAKGPAGAADTLISHILDKSRCEHCRRRIRVGPQAGVTECRWYRDQDRWFWGCGPAATRAGRQRKHSLLDRPTA